MNKKTTKHAFLIMAHHQINKLQLLLNSLDYENNDIYLHIDKKCTEDISSLKVKEATMFIIERKDVRWGGYSQIDCELTLLEYAIKNKYQYYHLLTGVSFPIKSNSYIHDFFDKNNGYEFVGFDNAGDYSNRLKYNYIFNEIGKTNTVLKKALYNIRRFYIFTQKILKVNHFKKYNMVCKKGFVYWSITDDFAQYVIEQKKVIQQMCKHSLCGDEVFLQTILYNSKFRDRIYDFNDEFNGCMRICPWGTSEIGYRKNYNFNMTDFDFLIKSKYLFALKFDDEESEKLLNKISKEIKENKGE